MVSERLFAFIRVHSRLRSGVQLLPALLLTVLAAGVVWAQERPYRAPRPVRPPHGAVVLFDGKDISQWTHLDGRAAEWNVAGGILEVKPGTGNIVTRRKFGDYRLHVEFNIPLMPDQHSQGRGNSGVYQHALYEVQVLDSYQNDTYAFGGCGAIYGQKDPDKNMARPPEQWQTYDITFRAPRFDSAGNVTEKPRITVIWNGVKVHDNVEIKGPTTASAGDKMVPAGPIMLQDHGARVRYRDIWIVPLDQKK